jgi:hypothetical protein
LNRMMPKHSRVENGEEIRRISSWDRCYDFWKKSLKKLATKFAFVKNAACYCKILINTVDFFKKTPFLCQKLTKIAENCDYNIEPWIAICIR